MQNGYQFAHNTVSLVQAKGIADCHTYGRRYLSHNSCIRISNRFPYFVHMGLDADRAGRTVNTALTAAYAVGLCQSLVKGRHCHGVCSSEREA